MLLLLAVLIAGGAGGCGAAMAPESPAAKAAADMAPGEAMAAAPPPAASAAPGGGKEDAAEKKKEEPKTWKRSQLGAHAVRVKIGDHDELPVRTLQANVNVDGFMARVVLDMVVKNDRGGTYEGTLQLRLPEGASPYFFAFGENVVQVATENPTTFFAADKARTMGAAPSEIMAARADLWRGPKEARMVPKEQAAVAYRDTMRRSVDPAIMEWAGPSVFAARVFPLTADRSHRIVIGYDVPLTRIGGDLEYVFDLPENVGSKVVDVALATPQGAVVEVKPAAPAQKSGNKSWYRFADASAKELTLRVKKPAPAHLEAADGSYFAADVVPALPQAAGGSSRDAALFLLDTSLSSNPDRMNVWVRLLESVLRNNRDTLKRFNVVTFNVAHHFWQHGFVANDDTNLAALKAHLDTLALEGATDLGAALRAAAAPPGAGSARWDLFLLSDGAATWGEADAFTMARSLQQTGAGSIFAYQTGMAGTDTDTLSLLARETGGAVFAVNGDAEVKAASTAHRARPFRLADVKVAGGDDVLVAGRPRFVYPGQVLRVVGRGKPTKGADVELTMEIDGASQTVRAPLGEAIPSGLAVRAYGMVATGQLEELLPSAERTATVYARHFRVTGKTCSLLMLESEADYQRFNIRPEDDVTAVAQSPAGKLVAAILTQHASRLGDPKAAFLSWLDELPRRAGVAVPLPEGLRPALEKLPTAAFKVDAAPLAVKRRDRAYAPANVQEALRTHKIEYDMFSQEAERRRAEQGPADGLVALSSLVEESPGDAVLARDVGMTALSWGLPAEAFHLFRRVAVARPFEPPTYRALAQSLVRLGKIDLAMAYFEVGLAGRWAQRFGDFHRILAVEYLELLRRIENGELKTAMPELAKSRYPVVASSVGLGKADMVVMITWNTDGTDVDLHVLEPSGEMCFYGHRNTQSGGQLTQDVTQGYGPEMYVLPSAPAGKYRVSAKYFASDRNRTSARTKVQVIVFENWGTSRQKVSEKTVVLEYNKQMHDLYDVSRGASAQVAR
jgi:Mg-chelatase subunit ChlD